MFKLNIKKLLGPVAFLAAMGMAFAFTPKRADNSISPKKMVHEAWIKIDCETQQPLFSDNGNITDGSEEFPFDCTGAGNICAVKLDLDDPSQAIPAPGQEPNNYQPVVDIQTLPTSQVVRCVE